MDYNYRFTLSHTSGSQVISEPIGWKDMKLTLERDPDFHTLIEHFEVPLIFYGNNGTHDGGKDFVQNVLQTFGRDEKVSIIIELSTDAVEYETLYTGILSLDMAKKLDDRKLQVPIVRDDVWTKFINLINTPVDIQSTTDLKGNAVTPCESIILTLPPQKVEQKFIGNYKNGGFSTDPGSNYDNYYFPFDVPDVDLNEINEKYTLPVLGNTIVPGWILEPEYEGSYEFDIRIEISRALLAVPDANNMQNGGDYFVRWYFQKNDETPIQFTIQNHDNTLEQSTSYSFNETHNLYKGDVVRVYGYFAAALGGLETLMFWGENNDGISVVPGSMTTFDFGAAPSGVADPSYFHIIGQTIYPETEAEAFLVHDVMSAVMDRITGTTGRFYSDLFGGSFTKARQYDSDGCASNYALIKGLHLRSYSLDEKKFFTSFKDLWDGLNPIFNLALSYEVNDDGETTFHVLPKSEVYDVDASLQLDFVNNIEEGFDKDYAFKKISIGYNEWRSDDIAGIDDPQTKKTYATRFEYIGKEITIYSKFIAASLAIENTRRKTREKSADYKLDDDTFIIAINPVSGSPADTYTPEIDENFDSVTNLKNSETRYNLFLTPLRNFLRWANFFNGGLQKYSTSSYKFVGGEGNYDFESDYNCGTGIKKDCSDIVCNNVSEKQDISLATYGPGLGYLFTPEMFAFEDHPLSWDEYKHIRNNRRNAIEVSRIDSDHDTTFIKRLEFDINKSKAKFNVWKK
jgi:hypothetical protein